jgi:hypothetical protein
MRSIGLDLQAEATKSPESEFALPVLTAHGGEAPAPILLDAPMEAVALRAPRRDEMARAESPRWFLRQLAQTVGEPRRQEILDAFETVHEPERVFFNYPDSAAEYLPILEGVIADKSLPVQIREAATTVRDAWYVDGHPLRTGMVLPYVESMNDLFKSVGPYCKGDHLDHTSNGLAVSRYLSIRAGSDYEGDLPHAVTVEATSLTLRAIGANMIDVKYDRINFEAIRFQDHASIYAKYSQILGSRLLAVIPAEAFDRAMAGLKPR